MMTRSISIVLIILLCSCHARQVLEDSVIQKVPFELTEHNNIAVLAQVNGEEVVLMFHTAANSLDLTRTTTAKLNSLKWNEEVDINTWGGAGSSRTSENNVLEIGEMQWDSLVVWENENSGPGTDGKFGMNFFDNQVVEINYDSRLIILHKSIPKYANKYFKVPLSYENGMLFVEANSTIEGDTFSNRFLIHSGYGGTVLYDDDFVSRSKIGQRIEITSQQELKDSHGNTLITKKGQVPNFKLGEINFENMPVGFFEGAIGRQRMSVLGGQILKRFNLIVDRERKFIYLQPSQSKDLPFSKS